MSPYPAVATTADLATLAPEERLALVQEAYGRAQRSNKYHAKRCIEHGGRHASLKECRRYGELVLLERGGLIRNLREQVRFWLCPEDCPRPLVYIADFTYEEPWTAEDGHTLFGWRFVVEDTKGVATPVFKLKRHLLAHQGMEVRVI